MSLPFRIRYPDAGNYGANFGLEHYAGVSRTS